MARTPQNYAHNQQLAATPVILVPLVVQNTSAVVRKLSFYNSGTVNRAVTVYIVETSGTADTGNTEVVKSIPPGKTWNVIEIQGEILETGKYGRKYAGIMAAGLKSLTLSRTITFI